MNELVVTTMLILQSDGRLTRPLGEYLAAFEPLAATGLPIVLYLDPALVGQVKAPNVTVVPTSIQDLELWQATRGVDFRLPSPRNLVKDCADYLLIINSKTELVRQTILSGPPAAQHAFVDFGLFHVIKDIELAQSRLRLLHDFPADRVVVPGTYVDGGDHLEPVNFHFCGGFFYGPPSALLAFADLHQEAVRALLPAISWEVNFWSWIEVHRGWTCHWYPAYMNDSILEYAQVFAGSHTERRQAVDGGLMEPAGLWYSAAMDSGACPRTAEDVEIKELDDGYIIYDARQDRVHFLNPTAVLILELCNGQVPARDVPSLVQAAYNLTEPPEMEVAECLKKLYEEGLIR